ncbi:hypothetical protein ABZ312_27950 [Streptomyces sp. NPDC006207]
MGLEHPERLHQALSGLSVRGEDVSHAGPVCYGGEGFTPALQQTGLRGQVVLVGLQRPYHGE